MNTRCLTCPLAALCLSAVCQAQDRHFAWTYESTTLPKGGMDIEPWFTYSTSHSTLNRRLTSRLEIELGLSDHLQTAFYLNARQSTFQKQDSTGVTGIENTFDLSFSNEWKVNVLNPSVKALGIGVYGEYTLAGDELELEFKLLLDKRWPRNILAFNNVWEIELEKAVEIVNGIGEITTRTFIDMENLLAWTYLVRPNLGLGIEVRSENEMTPGSYGWMAVSAGPSLFWSHTRDNGTGMFVIFSPLQRISHRFSGGRPFEVRAIVGLSL